MGKGLCGSALLGGTLQFAIDEAIYERVEGCSDREKPDHHPRARRRPLRRPQCHRPSMPGPWRRSCELTASQGL
jgi:hypothetical protein